MSASIVETSRKQALSAFVAEYRAGRFFEAHEVLEDAWLAADGDEKTFLQGLIQLAAAAHKGRRMRHARGMASLYAQAIEKLEGIAARHGDVVEGIGLGAVNEAARAAQARAARGEVDGDVPVV